MVIGIHGNSNHYRGKILLLLNDLNLVEIDKASSNVIKLVKANQEVGVLLNEVNTKYMVVGRRVSLENERKGLKCGEIYFAFNII